MNEGLDSLPHRSSAPKSPVIAWVLGCALAVVVLPVLYVLSVPWVYRWGVLPVELRRSYIQPYYWAAGYEPLTYYLIIYDDWCEHQLWLAYVKK